MMSNNSDYENNLLNRLAYVDLQENYGPGDNLIVALRDSGAVDLADELEKAGYGDYVIKDYENRNSTNGFVAIAIEDPKTGDVGISYRGTENLDEMGDAVVDAISGDADGAVNNQIDMIDNISTAVTGDSTQAQEALDFFERNQSTTGENFLYGHSKGGELAMEVYVENHENINSVHIINPQPVNWASLTDEQRAAVNNGKVDAVVIDGDIVWLLGGVPYPVRIIKNNGTQDGFFGPHGLESGAYDPETGEAIPEPNPYQGYMGQGLVGGGLTVLITMIQGGYEIIDTCVDWLDDARRFITETLPEYGRKAWDAVQDAWKEAKRVGLDIIDNVEDFFSDVGDAVEDWWSGLFGDDQNQSSSSSSGGACRVRVDTQLLLQVASALINLSHTIDTLEATVGSCAKAIQSASFAGTVMLRASLRGRQREIEDQKDAAEQLANTLKNIALLYEKSEKLACDAAKS